MRSPMDAENYRWSSHRAYLGKDTLVRIDTAPVLGEFARSVAKARLGYLRFIAEGKATGHQPDYYDAQDQRFLGDTKFVEQIDERIRAERDIEVPGPRAKFSELLRLAAKAYGANERDLVQSGRNDNG
jgi:putative transposase